MNEIGGLSDRQRRVIPHLLAAPSTEEACRRARINKTTVYGWLQDETFRQELKQQRDAVIERALDSLKALTLHTEGRELNAYCVLSYPLIRAQCEVAQ